MKTQENVCGCEREREGEREQPIYPSFIEILKNTNLPSGNMSNDAVEIVNTHTQSLSPLTTSFIILLFLDR